MKKYVFTKKIGNDQQMVTVETDGLVGRDGFIVTGLIVPKGKSCEDIIAAGMSLKMGDAVSSAMIFNMAKEAGCECRCYAGNSYVEEESYVPTNEGDSESEEPEGEGENSNPVTPSEDGDNSDIEPTPNPKEE